MVLTGGYASAGLLPFNSALGFTGCRRRRRALVVGDSLPASLSSSTFFAQLAAGLVGIGRSFSYVIALSPSNRSAAADGDYVEDDGDRLQATREPCLPASADLLGGATVSVRT